MDILPKEELRILSEKRNGFCLSMFLPTHRAGREIEKDRILLKDLLHDAETRLKAGGLQKKQIQELLSPVQELLPSTQFWRSQSEGLAIFSTHRYFRHFRLPQTLRAFVTVADRFDIAPLVGMWISDERFYLLALSLNQARLFEGTRDGISQIDVKDLPGSLQEALTGSVDESTRQQHTWKPSLPKDELLYFRQIDRGLNEILKDGRAPLVLAGVEDQLALYRQVSTYPELMEKAVAGNSEHLSAQQLHAKAREIAQEYYAQDRDWALREYRECGNPARTSHELGKILAAAYQGRVYDLFVAPGAQRWGNFDPERAEFSVHEEPQAGDQDLLNIAVVQTVLHGGNVYSVEPSQAPEGSSIAARFRY